MMWGATPGCSPRLVPEWAQFGQRMRVTSVTVTRRGSRASLEGGTPTRRDRAVRGAWDGCDESVTFLLCSHSYVERSA
jgi:hypothetical protein